MLRNILRFLFLFVAFGARAFAGDLQSSTYEPRNVEAIGGALRVCCSGATVFADDFNSRSTWNVVNNYEDLLRFEFGEDRESRAGGLVVSRPEGDDSKTDTAWSVATASRPVDPAWRGAEFVFRVVASASKEVRASAGDGDGWRTYVAWYDASGDLVERSEATFAASRKPEERVATGTVPENAAAYIAQIGFDIPNLNPGESTTLESVALEIVDAERPYLREGSFCSEFCFASDRIDVDCDLPQGCALKFQVASCAAASGREPSAELGEYLGPDGTSESYYELPSGATSVPIKVAAPFMTYKTILVPNGETTPILRSIRVGDRVDRNWKIGGDVEPPRVRLVGLRAAPNPDASAPFEIEIRDGSPLRLSELKVALDDEDVSERLIESRARNGATILTDANTEPYASGVHKVVVEVADARANAVVATRYFEIGAPIASPIVTLRGDGTTLIDGVPFFPIGLYGVCKRDFNGNDLDEAFRGLRDAGFNFAHSYSCPRDDEFIQTAEKYGFKLWSVFRRPDERFLTIERKSPAILAWYLGDDTSYNTTPEELYDYYYAAKNLDPSRITVQADPIESGASVTNYRPYVDGTDAFLPEIYPVREEGAKSGDLCVARAIRDVRRSRQDSLESETGVKAIWPIIQYFQGWGWKRFPTRKELRAMSFAAIAAGANGITWYTYGGFVDPAKNMYNYGVTTSPDRWSNISALATQIGELAPALVQETDLDAQPIARVLKGAEKNPLDEDALVALCKRVDRDVYLIAVNSNPGTVVARFEFPSATFGANAFEGFEVLFDEREIARPIARDRAIEEEFEAFGVRVYHWRDATR